MPPRQSGPLFSYLHVCADALYQVPLSRMEFILMLADISMHAPTNALKLSFLSALPQM